MSTAISPSQPHSGRATLRNHVDGCWVEPLAPAGCLSDRDPATGDLLAQVPLSGAADVGDAVRAAREAQPAWAATPPQKRARVLIALREALWEEREALARLVTRDMGKTLDDARGEVLRGIESVESAIAIPHLLKGENLAEVGGGVDVEMWRAPVGVVAAITPFNFPAMIPLWFLPYALACGNAFLLKPSERDPLPAARIVELVESVPGLPPGLVNLVHGGRDAVDALLDHPEIDAISFVGQASTARHVASRAAATGKRCQALGGAKNTLVVMPDADLNLALPAILSSAFGAAGQRCLAGSVAVLVGEKRRQAELLNELKSAAEALSVGPGDVEGVDVCPLIDPEARERIVAAIDTAAAEGAQIVLDGRGTDCPSGCLIAPSIVATEDRESDLVREELFGPLLAVVNEPDLKSALDFVNSSRYGNAGAIFTRSGFAAREYRRRVTAGMLGVNIGVPAPVAWFPFSGWKDSIDGDLHANGTDAVDFYTRKQVVTTRW